MLKLKSWQWSLIRIGVTVAAVLVLFAVVLGCCVESLLFRPPAWNGNKDEFTMLDAGSEKIALLYYPGAPGGKVILYSHGNAEDLSSVRYLLAEYQRHGYSAAGYDYEGYGASAGKPSSDAACRDIEAVYHYLTGEKGISPAEIVVIGFSVGSGPACYLAEKYPVGALVLEAPFASAFQVVLPFGGLPGDRFPNAERVRNIKVPLLVIHGRKDRVIPVRNGKKVFENAAVPGELILVPDAGHNDLKEVLDREYWKNLADFLR